MPRAKARYDYVATDKTKQAVSSVKRGLTSVRNHANTVGSSLGKIGGIAAVSLGAVVRSSLQTSDALAKTSAKLGIAQDKLQGLRLAASQTAGVSNKTLDLALQRMTRRLAEAANGTGEAKNAVQELGLSAKHLAAVSPDAAFKKIAEAMASIDGQGNKLRLAFKLFDSEGAALVNTLNAGVGALEDYQKEAIALGIAFTRVDTAKIEAANDAMEKAKLATQGVSNKLTVALAPILKVVSDRYVEAVKNQGDLTEKIKSGMNVAVRVIGVFADGWHGIKVAVAAVKVPILGIKAGVQALGAEFPAIGRAITNFLFAPLKLALAALAQFSDTAKFALEDLQNYQVQIFSSESADDAITEFNRAKEAINALALETIPSEELKRQLNEILRAAEIEANKIALTARSAANDPTRSGGGDDEAVKKEKGVAKQIHSIKQQLLRDEITLNDMRKRNYAETMAGISSLASSGNKKLAAIGKAAQVAEAVRLGILAIQQALSAAPPPYNFVLAGLVGIEQAKNVAAIKGSRAGGGSVRGGDAYRVGERGSEIFVPGENGTIVPNPGRAANDAPVNVHFHIVTNDSRSFSQSLVENKNVIKGVIQEAMLVNGRRPGF
ncbi:MAG: hypothetical protein AAF542_17830 [Pseudomonadota bacterium]